MATFRDVPRDMGAIARVQSWVRAADLALSSSTSSTQTTIKDDHMADTGYIPRSDRSSTVTRSVCVANDRSRRAHRRPPDHGSTFIEVLVSVVLLGTVCVAVLTAVRTSVVATVIERDHSRAFQWLQSADGVLQAAPRESCNFDPVADAPFTSGEEKVRVTYENLIRAQVANPPGWEDSQITIQRPILAWDGTQYWDPYDPAAPQPCFDPTYQLQLVTLRVTSPEGQIIETNEVVKRD